jgi:hypothetical protein
MSVCSWLVCGICVVAALPKYLGEAVLIFAGLGWIGIGVLFYYGGSRTTSIKSEHLFARAILRIATGSLAVIAAVFPDMRKEAILPLGLALLGDGALRVYARRRRPLDLTKS